jgi:cardiolipin synthase
MLRATSDRRRIESPSPKSVIDAARHPRRDLGSTIVSTSSRAWNSPVAEAVTKGPKFDVHAKCIVVDGEVALVTSANFTLRAHEQNVECGVLLEDPAFAHHLARQWLGLIDAGLVLDGPHRN